MGILESFNRELNSITSNIWRGLCNYEENVGLDHTAEFYEQTARDSDSWVGQVGFGGLSAITGFTDNTIKGTATFAYDVVKVSNTVAYDFINPTKTMGDAVTDLGLGIWDIGSNMVTGLWHTIQTDSMAANEAIENGDTVSATQATGDLFLTLLSLGLFTKGVRGKSSTVVTVVMDKTINPVTIKPTPKTVPLNELPPVDVTQLLNQPTKATIPLDSNVTIPVDPTIPPPNMGIPKTLAKAPVPEGAIWAPENLLGDALPVWLTSGMDNLFGKANGLMRDMGLVTENSGSGFGGSSSGSVPKWKVPEFKAPQFDWAHWSSHLKISKNPWASFPTLTIETTYTNYVLPLFGAIYLTNENNQ